MDPFDFREPINAWSHLIGLAFAPIGTLALWRRSRGERSPDRLSLLVFGASLTSCYAASTLYHALRLPPERLAAFDRMDRVGIFLLIAGTYTPLAWRLLRGTWRWSTLASIWGIAAVASALVLSGLPLPPPLSTGLYLAMGWGCLACYKELARAVSYAALRPLVAGGVLYSVGAAFNLMRWPVLVPGVFGAHELFHLFVLAGSLAHFLLILTVVVPYGYAPAAAISARTDAVVPANREGQMWQEPPGRL